MNEIEKAIKAIKIAIAEVEWNYPLDYAIAFETAIEALQEKLERKKGCSFCNDKRVVSFCATSYHSSLEPITIIEDLYFGFCPHCGRKLGENK